MNDIKQHTPEEETVAAEHPRTLSEGDRWYQFRHWWTPKHSIAAACLVVTLLVVGMIGLNVAAGRAAQSYAAASDAAENEVQQQLASLAEIAKETDAAENEEVTALRDQLRETQRFIAEAETPALRNVQFGAQLNPAYRDAGQRQFASTLQKIQMALARLVVFSDYQISLQNIMSDAALTASITDKDSAVKLHDAWTQAAEELRALRTDDAELRAATEKMAADTEHIAAYAETIAGYYEAEKHEELGNSQKELEKRLQTLRDKTKLLEAERQKMHAAIAEAMAQLQQM